MSKYKLTYFNFRGRAELSRYIFAQAGISYDDVRIGFEDWPKLKPTTICGHLPELLIDGDVVLSQSIAIARYLANRYDLAGKTAMEKARADMIIDITHDLLPKMVDIYIEKDPGKREEKRKELLESTLPSTLSTLDKLLKENNNGERYFVGNDVTWADFQVALMVTWAPDSDIGPCDF